MGMLAAAQPAEKRTKYYALESFYMRQGAQPARLHEYLRGSALPALRKAHTGPLIVLDSLIAPHMPQVMLILGFPSLDEWENLRRKLAEDQAYSQARAALDGDSEPPYDTQANVLVEATDYSPEIAPDAEPRKTSRIFELRVYHSPTRRQLRALHERFSSAEIKIFHRSGIHPILYSQTVFGPNMPNLTYLTPFENLAAREKAWEAFGADPEWAKVRKESVDKHGQISSVIQISFFRATAYSPIR